MDDRKINILIIEDNPGDARLIKELLNDRATQSCSYNVIHKVSLGDSLDSFDDLEPHLILLDLSLPDSSGLETFYKIKNRVYDIPIILLTGFDSEEFALSLLKNGAQDYLVKGSINGKMLVNSISFALERSNLLKQIQAQLEERLKAEKRANDYSLKLEDTIRNRDMLFSIIAHDLRSPFNTLLGMAEAMYSEFEAFSKEDMRKALLSFYTDSKNLYLLLSNLLDWANIQKDRIVINPAKLELNKIINEIISIYKKELNTKNINLNVDIPLSSMAFGDEATYNTVIRNLISNAIKFTPTDGQVSIALTDALDKFTIEVTNTGEKISENIADKIFLENSFVSTYGTRGEKGTGLGLMICKSFVNLNGGKIWYETKEKQGTTFYFTIEKYNKNYSVKN